MVQLRRGDYLLHFGKRLLASIDDFNFVRAFSELVLEMEDGI